MKKVILQIVLALVLFLFQVLAMGERPVLFVFSDHPGMEAPIPLLPDIPDDDFLCADVNEDGSINVLDIIAVVGYILGGDPDPFNLAAADVNADGAVNVLDIISITNIILQVPGIPCPCVPVVAYEEKTYNTVRIGDQCWFRDNLDVGTMINSVPLGGFQQTNNGFIEKYCYNNDPLQCDEYGAFYEWPEAMQYVTTEGAQGVCPEGWHIPTDAEWKILEGTVDSDYPVGDPEWDDTGWRGSDAGGKLKEAGTAHWSAPNTGATNLSGFTGLPAGCRAFTGTFTNMGYYGYFWTSTQSSSTHGWNHELYYFNDDSGRQSGIKVNGFSVRCIKDD